MCGKKLKKGMTIKLMILSLAPLALLTIIRNFSFQTQDNVGVAYSAREFICHNLPLLCVLMFCALWVLLAVMFYFIDFGVFRWSSKKSGYAVKNVKEDKEASLNFFLTLILPLLIDNVTTIQGALTFACILFIICRLLYKTNMFFDNPILTLLGYHLYSFEFADNKEMKKQYLGLCLGEISDGKMIKYKEITEEVLYIKEMKK